MANKEAVDNFAVNYEYLDNGLTAKVYDGEAIPDDVLIQLHNVNLLDIKSRLPEEEWDRAEYITRTGAFSDHQTWVQRRVHPNTQSGKEGWNRQLFSQPRATVISEGDTVIAGVWDQLNTSASTEWPKTLGWLEMQLKMRSDPAVPYVGPLAAFNNKVYVHIREAYVHPDAMADVNVEEGQVPLSGLLLAALTIACYERHPYPTFVTHTHRRDPADTTLTDLTAALKMQDWYQQWKTMRGYADARLSAAKINRDPLFPRITKLSDRPIESLHHDLRARRVTLPKV